MHDHQSQPVHLHRSEDGRVLICAPGDIVATLNAAGLVSNRGVSLSATALWRILTNPFYCGTIRYAGDTTEGTHEPLVTRAEFDAAQRRLAARRR